MDNPAMLGSFFRFRSFGAVVLGTVLATFPMFAVRSDASPSPAPSKSGATPVLVGPAGWVHVQGSSDGLGTWQGPGNSDSYQDIVVEQKAGYASLDALYPAEFRYISGLADVFGYPPTDTTLWGNHPAKYLSYTYSSPSGVPVTADVMIAVFGPAYSARYSKSISQYANTAAEQSLTTLCGHGAK